HSLCAGRAAAPLLVPFLVPCSSPPCPRPFAPQARAAAANGEAGSISADSTSILHAVTEATTSVGAVAKEAGPVRRLRSYSVINWIAWATASPAISPAR
ncbi:hypothetical protein, partial [Kitasatospora albolonga]|uniref:hypothetical protein n=1 Tax=Kitasatospora albolonga TaxID=68173 RepID=UPI0031E7427D